MYKKALFALLAASWMVGYSDNLGVYGQVYPIAEQDIMSFIKERLATMQQTGRLDEINQHFKDNVMKHVLRPTPVAGLTTLTQANTHYFDPTFVLSKDIYDLHGKLVASAGTVVNPLAKITFNEALIFINGDDAAQVSMARDADAYYKKQGKITKIILVDGNMRDTALALGRIYFDQSGVLTTKFGIQHVPAIVTQDGLRLRIDEYTDDGKFTPPPKADKKLIPGGGHAS